MGYIKIFKKCGGSYQTFNKHSTKCVMCLNKNKDLKKVNEDKLLKLFNKKVK